MKAHIIKTSRTLAMPRADAPVPKARRVDIPWPEEGALLPDVNMRIAGVWLFDCRTMRREEKMEGGPLEAMAPRRSGRDAGTP